MEWRVIFWLSLGAQTFKCVVLTLFGSGDKQIWNTPDLPKTKNRRELKQQE